MYIVERLKAFREKVENELSTFIPLDSVDSFVFSLHSNPLSGRDAQSRIEVAITLYLIWLDKLVGEMEKNPRYEYKSTIEATLQLPILNLKNQLDFVDHICQDFTKETGAFSSNHGQYGIYNCNVAGMSLGDITETITNSLKDTIMKPKTIKKTKLSFILDYANYNQNGNIDYANLHNDIKTYAVQVNRIKYVDLIDSQNGVYVFMNENLSEILYVGKSSSRSFSDRLAAHITNNPHGYMNGVMKYLAWLKSSSNRSQKEFLDDNNKKERDKCFKDAAKILKSLKIAFISFGGAYNTKALIENTEKLLINQWNPLLNRLGQKPRSYILNVKKLI